MARSLLRQDTQIRTSDVYDDTIAPSEANMETNPLNIEEDLNALRSLVSNLLDGQAGNWFDDLNTPSALDTGSQRGVNDLNTDLHAVQRKRILRRVLEPGKDVAVGGADNFVVLGTGELPTNTTAAVGNVTTEGTVVAFHTGTFGQHALDEVSGPNALQPDNIVRIRDATTLEPIESSDREIMGLLQIETNTDGLTITDTTPNRVQISFVRINGTGDDLEAVPAVDIQGKSINYAYIERQAWEDIPEHSFLGPDFGDSGATSATRQAAYDNQGTTPVNLSTDADLDLAAGVSWSIRDLADSDLFRVTEN